MRDLQMLQQTWQFTARISFHLVVKLASWFKAGLTLQMSQEHTSASEALALSARRDAEAAAAEREAAQARLSESQAALEAEQNKVRLIEVSNKVPQCVSQPCFAYY